MKNKRKVSPFCAVVVLIAVLSAASLITCRRHTATGPGNSYAEPEDPAPDPTADWAAVSPGLHAAPGSIDHRYLKHSIPRLKPRNGWRDTAWRGEKISAQLVLWSRDPIRQAACTFSDFIDESGNRLPAQIAQARFVRYVITDEFADGCGHRRPEDYAAYLYPDALDPVPGFDLPGESTRPVWITIQVPADTGPGIYRSSLNLSAPGQQTQSFEFELEVLSRLLPPPDQWKFHLDLWQNPYAVARFHKVAP